MEKFIMDERTGLKYELVGDYYLIAIENEPVPEPLGIWGNGIVVRYGEFCCVHN